MTHNKSFQRTAKKLRFLPPAEFNPDCPLAIFRDFEASCERSPWRWGEAGSNGYH